MSVTTDLVAVLQALPAVTALLGERVYPLTLPQGVTLPALWYQQIDDPPELSHSGPAAISHPRVQLTIHAATYAAALAVAAVLRATLHGSARWGPGCASWIANEWDDYDPETQHFIRIVDVIVWR